AQDLSAVLQGQQSRFIITCVSEQAYQMTMCAFVARVLLHPSFGMPDGLVVLSLVHELANQSFAAFRHVAFYACLPIISPRHKGGAVWKLHVFQQAAAVVVQAVQVT